MVCPRKLKLKCFPGCSQSSSVPDLEARGRSLLERKLPHSNSGMGPGSYGLPPCNNGRLVKGGVLGKCWGSNMWSSTFRTFMWLPTEEMSKKRLFWLTYPFSLKHQSILPARVLGLLATLLGWTLWKRSVMKLGGHQVSPAWHSSFTVYRYYISSSSFSQAWSPPASATRCHYATDQQGQVSPESRVSINVNTPLALASCPLGAHAFFFFHRDQNWMNKWMSKGMH